MYNSSHLDYAKAIVTILIVLIAFGIFMLFYNNSDNILQGDSFYSLVTLTVIVFSLLIGLLYLVNNSKHPHAQRVSARKHNKARSRR